MVARPLADALEAGDRLLHDLAMVGVVQALADELLGDGDRDVGDFLPQLLARAPEVRGHLRASGLDEPGRLAARGLDQPALLLGGLGERGGADGLGLGVRGLDLRRVLLALALGLGACRLRLLERFLDRLERSSIFATNGL